MDGGGCRRITDKAHFGLLRQVQGQVADGETIAVQLTGQVGDVQARIGPAQIEAARQLEFLGRVGGKRLQVLEVLDRVDQVVTAAVGRPQITVDGSMGFRVA